MAAFTTFSQAALARYILMFDLGEVVACEAISAGIENSNYFLTLSDTSTDSSEARQSQYVLTITEDLSFEQAPFFSQLLTQLARHHLPVPAPQRTLDGMASTIFCGKPTWLFPRLPGTHPERVTPGQCFTIGKALAELHLAANGSGLTRSNPYDLGWQHATLERFSNQLIDADLHLLQDIIAEYQQLDPSGLPRGIIHGDLFRDNALFVDQTLTGLIDFYHACDDYLVQDLAITVNDWCSNPDGSEQHAAQQQMREGYESIRPLTEAESRAFRLFQRAGALRFVLTRYISGEEGTPLKDPEEFLRIVRQLAC